MNALCPLSERSLLVNVCVRGSEVNATQLVEDELTPACKHVGVVCMHV